MRQARFESGEVNEHVAARGGALRLSIRAIPHG